LQLSQLCDADAAGPLLVSIHRALMRIHDTLKHPRPIQPSAHAPRQPDANKPKQREVIIT
jgi:hypothetical protein